MTIKIVEKSLDDLIPYENNPRDNSRSVDKVMNSIKRFGFKVPIVVDKNNVIVAGHTRYQASKKLKLKKVPCIVADDLSEQEIKAYRLADNKVGEESLWMDDMLAKELEGLEEFNMSEFGFKDVDDAFEEDDGEDNHYTMKTDGIQYIPDENVDYSIEELVDDSKTKELLERINQADVSEEIKKFLTYSAYRHLVFDYGKIADYYAKADAEVQRLFEESALVIIDFEDAMKNGYVKTFQEIEGMRFDLYGDDGGAVRK